VFSSLRVHTKLDAIFSREVDGDIQHVRGNFTTRPQVVPGSHVIDINEIVDDLNEQIKNWNSRGSGFTIERISRFVLCITKFDPLKWTPSYGSNVSDDKTVTRNDKECNYDLW